MVAKQPKPLPIVSAGESKPKGGCGKSPESGEKYPRRHPQGQGLLKSGSMALNCQQPGLRAERNLSKALWKERDGPAKKKARGRLESKEDVQQREELALRQGRSPRVWKAKGAAVNCKEKRDAESKKSGFFNSPSAEVLLEDKASVDNHEFTRRVLTQRRNVVLQLLFYIKAKFINGIMESK